MSDLKKCCICGNMYSGCGNNPYPVVKDKEARCCDACDASKVIPARIAEMYSNRRR